MAKITKEQVHQAAAELDAQGIKPTTSKIREKIGSGSFSTIQTFLEGYNTPHLIDELPEPPTELNDLIPIIWAKTYEISNGLFEAERLKAEEKEKALQNEIETLKKIIEDQDEKIEDKEKKLNEKNIGINVLMKKTESLKEENAYLKGKIDAFLHEEKKKTKPEPKTKPKPKPATEPKPAPEPN